MPKSADPLTAKWLKNEGADWAAPRMSPNYQLSSNTSTAVYANAAAVTNNP